MSNSLTQSPALNQAFGAMLRSVSGKRLPLKYGYWGKNSVNEEKQQRAATTGSQETQRGGGTLDEGAEGGEGEGEEGEGTVVCRICEEEVVVSQLEAHSQLCRMANQCDARQLPVDERLVRLAGGLSQLAGRLKTQLYPDEAEGGGDGFGAVGGAGGSSHGGSLFPHGAAQGEGSSRPGSANLLYTDMSPRVTGSSSTGISPSGSGRLTAIPPHMFAAAPGSSGCSSPRGGHGGHAGSGMFSPAGSRHGSDHFAMLNSPAMGQSPQQAGRAGEGYRGAAAGAVQSSDQSSDHRMGGNSPHYQQHHQQQHHLQQHSQLHPYSPRQIASLQSGSGQERILSPALSTESGRELASPAYGVMQQSSARVDMWQAQEDEYGRGFVHRVDTGGSHASHTSGGGSNQGDLAAGIMPSPVSRLRVGEARGDMGERGYAQGNDVGMYDGREGGPGIGRWQADGRDGFSAGGEEFRGGAAEDSRVLGFDDGRHASVGRDGELGMAGTSSWQGEMVGDEGRMHGANNSLQHVRQYQLASERNSFEDWMSREEGEERAGGAGSSLEGEGGSTRGSSWSFMDEGSVAMRNQSRDDMSVGSFSSGPSGPAARAMGPSSTNSMESPRALLSMGTSPISTGECE